MKSISQLARKNIEATQMCRAKRVGVDMMLRKEYRRAKKVNYFSKDYTSTSSLYSRLTNPQRMVQRQKIQSPRLALPIDAKHAQRYPII